MVDLKTTSFQAPRFFFVIKLPWLCSFNEITFSHLGLPWHGLKRMKRVKFKFGFHCSVLYMYDILVISQNTGWQSVCRTSDGRSSGTLESLKMLSVTHGGLTQGRVVFLAARIFSLTYYLSTFTSWPPYSTPPLWKECYFSSCTFCLPSGFLWRLLSNYESSVLV